MINIVKEVRDLNRFRRILIVLFESGFEFILDRIRLKKHLPLKTKIKKPKVKEAPPEVRLRKTLEKLGPTFIKFGQLLSVRPDLVPKQYCRELEKLQDSVPPFPYEEVRKEIEKELNSSIKSIFSYFSKEPIASASISQVHKAKLISGEKVAVKVQRPNVRKIMQTDIEIMFFIAKLLEKHIPELRRYQPVKVVHEFSEWTKKELDFKQEARNAKIFYNNFKKSETIKIPIIYEQFTTTKILTLEYIDAIEVSNIEELKKRKLDLKKILDNGFNAILTQVFEHGFFHADPHPGNILVLENNKVAFVDFGIVGHFDEKLKHKSVDLLSAIVDNDSDRVVEALLNLGNIRPESIDMASFKIDISEIISNLQNSDIKDIKISHVLENIMDSALHYRISMPMEFVLLGKTIITLEGIALEYQPDFKLINNLEPFIQKLIIKRANPMYAINSAIESLTKIKKLAAELPDRTDNLLRKLERGELKIDIEDRDIKTLSIEIDRSSNRLAYGMIISASLIAGSLTVQMGPAVILGLSVLSLTCFLVTFISSMLLFFSIIKEKRLLR